MKTWGAAFLCVLVLMVGLAHTRLYWDWLVDDAYISYRYAENLATGNGLVYNSGERVEGYSNFTWVLLTAAALERGADPVLVTRGLGVISVALIIVLAWLAARRLRPEARWSPLVAPAALAVSATCVRHGTNGLETSFAAALLLAMVTLLLGPPRLIQLCGAAVLGVLLAMTRPEGGFMAALVLAPTLWWRFAPPSLRGGLQPATRPFVLSWTIFLIGWGAYWTWRWLHFGAAFPNTYYAKVTNTAGGLIDGLQYAADFARNGGGLFLLVLAVIPLVAGSAGRRWWHLLFVVVMGTGFAVVAGGDWMVHYRFFAPLLPLLAVLAAAGVADLFATLRGVGARRTGFVVLAGLALVAGLGTANYELSVWREIAPALAAGNYRVQGYQQAGEWLEQRTQSDDLIAASDIGAVGYFSKRPILDMFGLVDYHIARLPGKQHHKVDAQYFLAKRPRYFMIIRTDSSKPTYLRLPDGAVARTEVFRRDYVLRKEIGLPYHGEVVQIFERTMGAGVDDVTPEESTRPPGGTP